MKKIIGSLILIVSLGIFSGCQTNPDGSIGGQAKILAPLPQVLQFLKTQSL